MAELPPTAGKNTGYSEDPFRSTFGDNFYVTKNGSNKQQWQCITLSSVLETCFGQKCGVVRIFFFFLASGMEAASMEFYDQVRTGQNYI